jgi:hypothetical protein
MGICYLKKQNRNDFLPFRFQQMPNPPRGGTFRKQSNVCGIYQ